MDESAAIAGSGNPLKSRFESKIQGKNILKIRQSVCLFTLLLTLFICVYKNALIRVVLIFRLLCGNQEVEPCSSKSGHMKILSMKYSFTL